MADAQAERLKELLERIVEGLGLDATVSVTAREDEIVGTVDGDDLAVFIGRHGTTIDAVQRLARRIVQGDDEGPRRRLTVDAAGYRERRRRALEKQADQAAKEAERYGRPVALDAMTASERKYVHEYLRARGGVKTHSEGEEPERHLIITPLRAARTD